MNLFRRLRPVFLTVLIPTVLPLRIVRAADSPDVDRQVLEGMKLSEEDAQQLEETLKHKPEDLSIRAKLLGYYSSRHLRSEWNDGIAEREVLWLIEHHPEARLVRPAVCAVRSKLQSVGLSRRGHALEEGSIHSRHRGARLA